MNRTVQTAFFLSSILIGCVYAYAQETNAVPTPASTSIPLPKEDLFITGTVKPMIEEAKKRALDHAEDIKPVREQVVKIDPSSKMIPILPDNVNGVVNPIGARYETKEGVLWGTNVYPDVMENMRASTVMPNFYALSKPSDAVNNQIFPGQGFPAVSGDPLFFGDDARSCMAHKIIPGCLCFNLTIDLYKVALESLVGKPPIPSGELVKITKILVDTAGVIDKISKSSQFAEAISNLQKAQTILNDTMSKLTAFNASKNAQKVQQLIEIFELLKQLDTELVWLKDGQLGPEDVKQLSKVKDLKKSVEKQIKSIKKGGAAGGVQNLNEVIGSMNDANGFMNNMMGEINKVTSGGYLDGLKGKVGDLGKIASGKFPGMDSVELKQIYFARQYRLPVWKVEVAPREGQSNYIPSLITMADEVMKNTFMYGRDFISAPTPLLAPLEAKANFELGIPTSGFMFLNRQFWYQRLLSNEKFLGLEMSPPQLQIGVKTSPDRQKSVASFGGFASVPGERAAMLALQKTRPELRGNLGPLPEIVGSAYAYHVFEHPLRFAFNRIRDRDGLGSLMGCAGDYKKMMPLCMDKTFGVHPDRNKNFGRGSASVKVANPKMDEFFDYFKTVLPEGSTGNVSARNNLFPKRAVYGDFSYLYMLGYDPMAANYLFKADFLSKYKIKEKLAHIRENPSRCRQQHMKALGFEGGFGKNKFTKPVELTGDSAAQEPCLPFDNGREYPFWNLNEPESKAQSMAITAYKGLRTAEALNSAVFPDFNPSRDKVQVARGPKTLMENVKCETIFKPSTEWAELTYPNDPGGKSYLTKTNMFESPETTRYQEPVTYDVWRQYQGCPFATKKNGKDFYWKLHFEDVKVAGVKVGCVPVPHYLDIWGTMGTECGKDGGFRDEALFQPRPEEVSGCGQFAGPWKTAARPIVDGMEVLLP